MGQGYVRNDTSNNIANGNTIDADDIDGEFNALEASFVAATGHTHDGTTAEGGPVSFVGPAQDVEVTASAITVKADNTYDLGESGTALKDGFFAGDITAASFIGAVTGDVTGNADTATALETARTLAISGQITGAATSFDGTGNISIPVSTLSATNLNAGTVPSARVSGEYSNITGVGALSVGTIVSGFGPIDIGTAAFTGNGANITDLDAANLTGVVPSIVISGDYSGFGSIVGSGSASFSSFGAGAGSTNAPSYTFSSDLDTGVYSPAANQLAFTTAGTTRANFTGATLDLQTYSTQLVAEEISASSTITTDSNLLVKDGAEIRLGLSVSSGGFSVAGFSSFDENIYVGGNPASDDSQDGVTVTSVGQVYATRSAGAAVLLRRDTSDGQIIRFKRGSSECGSVTVTTSTTSYNTSSDERLKSDERDFDPSAVMDLIKFYEFDWNEDYGGETAYGVFAQELYQIYPQAVHVGKGEPGDENFEPWSVDYSKLVPIMGRAMQKQEERLSALEARLEAAGL